MIKTLNNEEGFRTTAGNLILPACAITTDHSGMEESMNPKNNSLKKQPVVFAALCVGCGKYKDAYGMDVNPVQTPNSAECIRCGACIDVCQTKAVCLTCRANPSQTLP